MPAVVIDVDENGGFIFFELVLSMKGLQVFTDVHFSEENSKEFNKYATTYGSRTYY